MNSNVFRPDELVTYIADEAFIDKIDYFRKHDEQRKGVAQRGWAAVHGIFSETVVARWILDIAADRIEQNVESNPCGPAMLGLTAPAIK
jgi:hypothetical protein